MDFVIHWNETAMGLHEFPIPIPPPTSLSARSLWVFPVHQAGALISCIQPGLVICFTLDNIHVSMLFSWNIPPSPSPTESKRLFYTSMSLFLFCISTLWIQAPLSIGFPRQEYWSALPFPSPGNLPNPGIEPASLYIFCIDSQVLYH